MLGSNAQLQGYLSQPNKHASTAVGTKYHTAPSCWHGGNHSHQMFAISETSGGREFTAPKNTQKGTDWVKPDTKQEEQPWSPHREWGRGRISVFSPALKGKSKTMPPPHFGSNLMSPKVGDSTLKSKKELNKFSARTVLPRRPGC